MKNRNRNKWSALLLSALNPFRLIIVIGVNPSRAASHIIGIGTKLTES
jgi:hypothetical protein